MAIGLAASKVKRATLSSGVDDSQRAVALGMAVVYKAILPVAIPAGFVPSSRRRKNKIMEHHVAKLKKR
jgi:hypothetical protein